jgi:hypothetical protein
MADSKKDALVASIENMASPSTPQTGNINDTLTELLQSFAPKNKFSFRVIRAEKAEDTITGEQYNRLTVEFQDEMTVKGSFPLAHPETGKTVNIEKTGKEASVRAELLAKVMTENPTHFVKDATTGIISYEGPSLFVDLTKPRAIFNPVTKLWSSTDPTMYITDESTLSLSRKLSKTGRANAASGRASAFNQYFNTGE